MAWLKISLILSLFSSSLANVFTYDTNNITELSQKFSDQWLMIQRLQQQFPSASMELDISVERYAPTSIATTTLSITKPSPHQPFKYDEEESEDDLEKHVKPKPSPKKIQVPKKNNKATTKTTPVKEKKVQGNKKENNQKKL